jgi:uncharacterized protein (TIGR02453 family)
MAIDTSTFTGFRPEAVDFLVDLAAHNERDWFMPRKAEFERLLKRPLEDLVAAVAERFETRDIPLHADPKRSVFRIYRDTRFSRDKSPYKTHLAATFPWMERTGGGGLEVVDGGAHGNGGYFNFQPGEMYVGGGMWMPEKARLDAFRRAIVEDPERVRAALEDPGFQAEFGTVTAHEHLKRVPGGLPADHPMADLFRYKDVVFGRHLSDDEVLSPSLPDTLVDAFVAGLPVFRFLATIKG